jgi:hypothetical protein
LAVLAIDFGACPKSVTEACHKLRKPTLSISVVFALSQPGLEQLQGARQEGKRTPFDRFYFAKKKTGQA